MTIKNIYFREQRQKIQFFINLLPLHIGDLIEIIIIARSILRERPHVKYIAYHISLPVSFPR